MSRENLRLNYALIVLLVVLAISLTGCLSLLEDVTADADDLQQIGPNETVETEVQAEQIEDENVTTNVSTGVASDVVETRYDPTQERVEVALTEDVDADHLIVEFGGDSTAVARLNEKGDRVVLTRDSLYVGGSAEDMTRELYSGEFGQGGTGGFAGVEYGDEIDVTVRAVEGQLDEVIYEESKFLGHGEVNADVEYLFDSTENAVRVILSSNVNADYVDVEVSMPGGGTISEFRLNEVGDEARIYADRPKVETRGSAEDLINEDLSNAIDAYERHRNEELELDTLLEEASNSSEKHTIFRNLGGSLNSKHPDRLDLRDRVSSMNEVDDIREEIEDLEDQLENTDSASERQKINFQIDALKKIERDLTYVEAEEITLTELNRLFLKYNGQMSDEDEINDYLKVLDEDIFNIDSDLAEVNSNVDVPSDSTIRGQYETPARDELVNIQAVAHIQPSSTDSGIRRRGGVETTVLDATGEIRSGGYVEVGEEVEDGESSSGSASAIELPSDGNNYAEGDGSEVSLDTDKVASLVHSSLSQARSEESLVGQGFESTYHLTRSAEENSKRLLNNINEEDELASIRSGEVPAQTTERNAIMRHMRNGATACNIRGTAGQYYSEGSPAVLSLEATGGDASVEGVVVNSNPTSTTINADFAAPVRVPNYALPFYPISSGWRANENVDAFVYDELVDDGASEQEVANAIVERWTSNDRFMETTTDTSYKYQGIGVSVDEETGVIYVTQSIC